MSPSTRFDLLLGLAVLAVGSLEANGGYSLGSTDDIAWNCLVPAGIGTAVALHRLRPGIALALVWLTGAFQLLIAQDLVTAELAIVIVAYGTARYGSVPVLWASLLSVPAAIPIALASTTLRHRGVPELTITVVGRLEGGVLRPEVVVLSVAVIVLGLPWLLGFALRMRGRAVASQEVSAAAERMRAAAEDQRAQAQQLAEARAEQTRLARDVHDVVGHSLAVILAQAQSGDFLPDSDPERLKQAMRNIADSARTSLQDVRRILTATSSDPQDAGGVPPDTDRLLDDVRTVGLDIRETVTGTARPLPPGLATTVYRVVQEMLTNTIKHGAPDGPVYVHRDWTNGLAIEVSNMCRADGPPQTAGAGGGGEPGTPGGRGLDGMRQRLADVGGTLAVSGDERDFAVRAWLPLPGYLDTPEPDLIRETAGG